jgi:Predicted metal-binding integral membrane protein (DUF2182)
MATVSSLESVLKRDRIVVMIGLALVVVVAAAYTLAGVGMNMSPLTMTRMTVEMPGMAMQPVSWSTGYAFVVFLMWCVMMVAMMVPSAAPMVLIHATIGRKQDKADRPLAATALFVAGYLSVAGVLDQAAEGVGGGANPDEPLYVDNNLHWANTRLALAKATRSHMHAFGIDWDDTSGRNNGVFAPFQWRGTGSAG